MKNFLLIILSMFMFVSFATSENVFSATREPDDIDYLKVISQAENNVDFAISLGVVSTGIRDEKNVLVYAAKNVAQEIPKIKSVENYNFRTFVNSGTELGLFIVSVYEDKHTTVKTLESGIKDYECNMNQVIPLIRQAEKDGVEFDFTVEHKDGAITEECLEVIADAYKRPEWIEVKGTVGEWTLCMAGSYLVTEMGTEIHIGNYIFYSFGQYTPDYLGIFLVNGTKAYTLKDAYDRVEINDNDMDKVIEILGTSSDVWKVVKADSLETSNPTETAKSTNESTQPTDPSETVQPTTSATENIEPTEPKETVKKPTAKIANPMNVTVKAKTVKAKKIKKGKVSVKAITVKKAKGEVKYSKVSGSKKLTINKTTGKIKIKKGTKKGNYTIKVKVTANGNKNYKSGSKTITVKIKVK